MISRTFLLAGLTGSLLTSGVRAQVPSAEAQIAGAVSAAPEGLRAAATVLGYRNYHRMDILRQGTNGIICLADDPSVERWQTSCYHQDLEPFMRRGRELRDLGLSHAQIDSARLMTWRAAAVKDAGARGTVEVSMAKLHATEAAQDVIDRAVQLLGGRGVVVGAMVEHLYRAIRPLRIYEGTSEIQRGIIGRAIATGGSP